MKANLTGEVERAQGSANPGAGEELRDMDLETQTAVAPSLPEGVRTRVRWVTQKRQSVGPSAQQVTWRPRQSRRVAGDVLSVPSG